MNRKKFFWPAGKWPRRRRILLGLLVALIVAVRLSIAPILGHILIKMVDEKLYARLEVADFSYEFPYGLTAHHCKLVLLNGDGSDSTTLLEVGELSASLEDLPLRGGPLKIDAIRVIDPQIHIVETKDGFAGTTGLVRPDPSPSATVETRLSDILRLRLLDIVNGQVIIENQRRPGIPATAWRDLTIKVNTVPLGSPGAYGFSFTAANAANAQMEIAGSFDIDAQSVTTTKLHMVVKSTGGNVPQLPPSVQELLAHYQIAGQITLDGSATASASDPSQNQCALDLQVAGATAYSPEVQARLDNLQFELRASATPHTATAVLSNVAAKAASVSFTLKDPLTVTVDNDHQTFSISPLAALYKADPVSSLDRRQLQNSAQRFNPHGSIEITAPSGLRGPLSAIHDWSQITGKILIAPRALSLQPDGFPRPISGVQGGGKIPPIRIEAGKLLIRDLRAHYFSDQLDIKLADLALQPLLNGQYQGSITAALIFTPPSAPYPQPIGDALQRFQPGGEIDVSANHVDIRPPRGLIPAKVQYNGQIDCDNATLTIANPPLAVTNITIDAAVFPGHAIFSRIKCDAFGGYVSGDVSMQLGEPFGYSGDIYTQRIDLPQVVAVGTPNAPPMKGAIDLRSSFFGTLGPDIHGAPMRLQSQGQLELSDGDLWDVPIMEKIQDQMNIARSAMTVGRAACKYRIQNGQVELTDAAVACPILGVQGYGAIGLVDGKIDLDLIAAPLGDWKDRMQKAGVWGPLSDFVGGVQNMLNNVTVDLLYNIHAAGTMADPSIKLEASHTIGPKVAHGIQVFKNVLQQPDDHPINMLNDSAK